MYVSIVLQARILLHIPFSQTGLDELYYHVNGQWSHSLHDQRKCLYIVFLNQKSLPSPYGFSVNAFPLCLCASAVRREQFVKRHIEDFRDYTKFLRARQLGVAFPGTNGRFCDGILHSHLGHFGRKRFVRPAER